MNCLPFTAWRTLEPLRAPSGMGRLAKRLGGRAWLAHRGDCCRGCAHRERAEGHLRQVARRSGERPMAGYARKKAKSSGEPMAECKEGVLLLQYMQRAGTQSRGAGLHHTRAAAAQCQSAALHKSDGARDVHKCWHVGATQKSLKFEAKHTSFWSARRWRVPSWPRAWLLLNHQCCCHANLR